MPGAIWPVNRFPKLIPGRHQLPGFDAIDNFRQLSGGSLAFVFLIHTCRLENAFSITLTTMALTHSRLWSFAISPCWPNAGGHNLPSLMPLLRHTDIDVPVKMRPDRLREAGSFLRGLLVPAIEPTGRFEDAVHRRGTHGHHVVIEHHGRQAAVAFQRMAVVVVEDSLLFPILQPTVAGHPSCCARSPGRNDPSPGGTCWRRVAATPAAAWPEAPSALSIA